MTRKPLISLLLVLFLTPVCGQQPSAQNPSTKLPPPPPAQQQKREDADDVVRITANLVQVDVVVTRDGKQVNDLTADDFELFEDDKPQKITNFSYVSNVTNATAPTAPVAIRANVKYSCRQPSFAPRTRAARSRS